MKVLEKIIVVIKNGKAQIPRTKNVEIEIYVSQTGLHLKVKNLTNKCFHIESPFLFIRPKGERFWLFTKDIPKELDLSIYEITTFVKS